MSNVEDPRRDRELWNDRYRSGDHPSHEEPAALLTDNAEWLPGGRALDVATGGGRNALFLAERGYVVDAVDISEVGLSIARRKAARRDLEVNWVQGDLGSFHVPRDSYDVVSVIGYYDPDLLDDLKGALAAGGVLLYQHHLGPSELADRGPSSDRFRFRSNELLHACLDLTVLDYRERSRVVEADGDEEGIDPVVSIIARNGLDGEPWYPPER